MHFGSFRAKAVWRPLTNLPAAGELIGTPQPVTLPEGNHPVGTPSARRYPWAAIPGAALGAGSAETQPLRCRTRSSPNSTRWKRRVPTSIARPIS